MEDDFDDDFDEFFKNNKKNSKKKLDDFLKKYGNPMDDETSEEMDGFMDRLNNHDEDSDMPNPMDELGEPDEIQEKEEGGMIFIKKIWHQPNGVDIILGEIRIDEEKGEMDPKQFSDIIKKLMGGYIESPPYHDSEGKKMKKMTFEEMMAMNHPKTKTKLTLKKQLEEALENEDYEKAAKLRDEIAEAKEKKKKSKKK